MPSASTQTLGDDNRVVDRAARVRFRRAVSLMLMTLVLPGSAQLVAGNRRVGRIALRIWFALVLLGLVALVTSITSRDFAFWAVSNTLLLGVLRLALMALAIGWAALFVDAWRIGQPLSLRQNHRLAVVGVNGVLCFSVAGTLLMGAHMVGVQRDFMITMFGDGEVVGAHDGRFNVLLLGGDSGAGRWGLRPDSMTIASVDAETGKSVLISLPRNMQNFPFSPGSVMAKEFPKGFDCDGCYLNGVSTWAGDHTDLFKGSKQPGVDATIMAIEGITDLKINYWAMVNLEGFKDLVDAVGGVELTVRDRIPVGGLGSDVTGYIEPGTRTLDGHDTLWFARSREGSDDYSRMARQKCVMGAMLEQISPEVAVRNFQKIAKASTQMISTNVPQSEVDNFMGLALRAKSQKIATLSLVPPMINTAEPDIALVQQKITEAIDKSEGKQVALAAAEPAPSAASGKKKAKPTTPSLTGGSIGSLRDGYAANDAEDLGSAC
ncbi:LCP family protein [Nocardioides sp. InS609-2]|uniref:LCP family protein n=1 Tax=Nocardioides sp. InS609-2 TaxID=2760705 RepID=UPI0020BDE320|nr:LCP family protein [Nocardioides sp. InS609-2]